MTKWFLNLSDTARFRVLAGTCVAAAIFALVFAYISQYGFGLQPCHLCLLQRKPYMAIIFVGLIGLLFARHLSNWHQAIALGLICGAFIITGSIAVFQVGVEQGWWTGTEACVGTSMANLTTEQMLARITSAPTVRCDEIQFQFLGISMAGYNALFAYAMAAFTFAGLVVTLKKK